MRETQTIEHPPCDAPRIGLYAVMSYMVSQSTRELGLRMALGARASNLLRLVLLHSLALVLSGVVIGDRCGTRVDATHCRLAFGSAVAVMTVTALVASFVPAWRAMRIDPLRALRN